MIVEKQKSTQASIQRTSETLNVEMVIGEFKVEEATADYSTVHFRHAI